MTWWHQWFNFNVMKLQEYFLWAKNCCVRASKADMEEKKLLNKVVIFVFFSHKKYYCSFIKLRLNHWCHMDYFNDVLTTFLGLERGSCISVYAGSESSRISSKISSFVLRRWMKFYEFVLRESYEFGTTWGWVINDRIFIFGWTIPLMGCA